MADKKLTTYFALFNEIGIISQLSRVLFEAQLQDGFLLPHFTVLNHLVRVGDGKTPLELSRAFQVPKASMTHTLTGLTKAGYIETRTNEQDGRSKRVFITKAGRTFRDDAIQGLAPDVAVISKHFSMKDATAILPELHRLREVLDKMRS